MLPTIWVGHVYSLLLARNKESVVVTSPGETGGLYLSKRFLADSSDDFVFFSLTILDDSMTILDDS